MNISITISEVVNINITDKDFEKDNCTPQDLWVECPVYLAPVCDDPFICREILI